jgi:nucleotide-binding universal stress UspA family protein
MSASAYRTILVPLDGSTLAERALPYATALAQAAGARLLLVRAAEARAVPEEATWVGETPAGGARGQRAPADREPAPTRRTEGVGPDPVRYLDEIAGGLVGQAVEPSLVLGPPGEVIVREARERGADLIVMATHGRSGLGRSLYGSVADHVLRHAPAPVLLVSAVCEPAWPADGPGRILVPLDGSVLAEAALAPAAALAGIHRARLLLLRVVEPPTTAGAAYAAGYVSSDDDAAAALGEAEGYLEEVACGLREGGCPADVAAAAGPAAAAIARVARERGAGLIAMATHGRSGLGRLVLGSVATSTLHQATAPLLLVRPGLVPSPPTGGGVKG